MQIDEIGSMNDHAVDIIVLMVFVNMWWISIWGQSALSSRRGAVVEEARIVGELRSAYGNKPEDGTYAVSGRHFTERKLKSE